jgi:membrane-associated phospholipid phosphatase
MFGSHPATIWHFWHLVTRLGEAQVVLPLALMALAGRARNPEARSAALRWITWLGLAMLVTLASKVAFIGWGIGSAALDFTGISGHTMFAAAVYPTLGAALASGSSARARRAAIAAGCALALLVGLSRVVLGTHSISEIIAGWFVGGLVSLVVLCGAIAAQARIDAWLVAVTALWMTLIPATAPTVDTHSFVTRLALELSGHQQPFTRRQLLSSEARQRRSVEVPWSRTSLTFAAKSSNVNGLVIRCRPGSSRPWCTMALRA